LVCVCVCVFVSPCKTNTTNLLPKPMPLLSGKIVLQSGSCKDSVTTLTSSPPLQSQQTRLFSASADISWFLRHCCLPSPLPAEAGHNQKKDNQEEDANKEIKEEGKEEKTSLQERELSALSPLCELSPEPKEQVPAREVMQDQNKDDRDNSNSGSLRPPGHGEVEQSWAASAFMIDRGHEQCRTPRRNPDVAEAIASVSELYTWALEIEKWFCGQGYYTETSGQQALLLPVLPLLRRSCAARTEQAAASQPRATESFSNQDLQNLSKAQSTRWRDHVKSLAHALAEPPSSQCHNIPLSWNEASVFGLLHATRAISKRLLSCLDGLEELGVRTICAALVGQIPDSQATPAFGDSNFDDFVRYHARFFFKKKYRPRPIAYSVRRPNCSVEGVLTIEHEDGEPISTTVRAARGQQATYVRLNAATTISLLGEKYVHGCLLHRFSVDHPQQLWLEARSRRFSGFVLLLGTIIGADGFEPKAAMVVQNEDQLRIPLLLETIPTPKEFAAAVKSMSPEQEQFCKAYREMQLANSLFGVCVVQIKPQLETLLNLPEKSLDKEIALVQHLLQLLMKYQISPDLLAAEPGLPELEALQQVQAEVKKMFQVIQQERGDELEKKRLEQLALVKAKEARMISRIIAVSGPPTVLRVVVFGAARESAALSWFFDTLSQANLVSSELQSTSKPFVVDGRVFTLKMQFSTVESGWPLLLQSDPDVVLVEFDLSSSESFLAAKRALVRGGHLPQAVRALIGAHVDKFEARQVSHSEGSRISSNNKSLYVEMFTNVGRTHTNSEVENLFAKLVRQWQVEKKQRDRLAEVQRNRLAETRDQLERVKSVMNDNIEQVLMRGDALDLLEEKSMELETNAKSFKKLAKKKKGGFGLGFGGRSRRVDNFIHVYKGKHGGKSIAEDTDNRLESLATSIQDIEATALEISLELNEQNSLIEECEEDLDECRSQASVTEEQEEHKEEGSPAIEEAAAGQRSEPEGESEHGLNDQTDDKSAESDLKNEDSCVVEETHNPDVPSEDVSQLPQQLDQHLSALTCQLGSDEYCDVLRPTTIKLGDVHHLRRPHPQGSLVEHAKPGPIACSSGSLQLEQAHQAVERNSAFDLLETLSNCGALPFRHSSLHVVVAATHSFPRSLLEVLSRDNVNPIDSYERSAALVASVIHHPQPLPALVRTSSLAELQRHSPALAMEP